MSQPLARVVLGRGDEQCVVELRIDDLYLTIIGLQFEEDKAESFVIAARGYRSRAESSLVSFERTQTACQLEMIVDLLREGYQVISISR